MKREAKYGDKSTAASHVRRLKKEGRDAWLVRKIDGSYVVWSDRKPRAVWI